MLFSSVTFLFYFLPLLFLCYFFVHRNIAVANGVLLAFSLIFYAWGEPTFVAIMLLSIAGNYGFGRLIASGGTASRWWLKLGIVFNLSLLGYYKYLGFVMANLGEAFGLDVALSDTALPLGISFFTFQAITYLVDLARGEIKVQKNFLRLALYISLFPQLIAGPIVRYQAVEDQLSNRTITRDDLNEGIRRFIIGFAKKLLIANTFAIIADEIFAMPQAELTTRLLVIGVVAYTLQIYFDFSAYSDMAIGLGHMFGFRFPENFNYPYMSRSVQEFWRRWHMSLSSFLRDYLYIPLGGSRGSTLQTYRNLIIVFFLCGFWHGAEWTFIIWGLYYGVFLILERMFLGAWLQKLPALLSWLYAMIVVLCGWFIFRAENLDQLMMWMDVFSSSEKSSLYKKYAKDSFVIAALVVAFVGATPLFNRFVWQANNVRIRTAMDIYLMVCLLLAIGFLAAGTYNPFIYFRF